MKIGKKMKALRKEKKMTLNELSRKSGVQIATLSRMENDMMTGTLKSHIKICETLGVALADFYRDLEYETKTAGLAKRKGLSLVHSKESAAEILATNLANKKMMPLLLTVRKNGETQKEKNAVGSEKFVYVLEGRIRASIGKEGYNLSRGDSIYFDASVPHELHNIGKAEARALSILSPPSI